MTYPNVQEKTSSAVSGTPILALSLAAFASSISFRVTDPLLPRLSAEFSVPLGTASYVITSFSIAYGLAQLFFGPLGDRFGKYLVVAWACAAGGVMSLLCGLAPNFSALLVGRLLTGGAAAALVPLSMAWIGDVVPYAERQPVLARYLIGQILGLSAGSLVGGLAADVLGWRTPFIAIALMFVAVSLLLFSVNRRLPAHAKITHQAEGGALARMASEFKQVLMKSWPRAVLLSVFLEGLFLYGAFAFIATHVHLAHGISLFMAGSLVMLFGAGGVLYAMCSKVLVREMGEVKMARIGGLLVAISLFAVGIGPAWWWAIPGCFFAGVGFYMLHNTLQINATQMAPERRGAAVSAFAASFFLGQSAGVGLSGALVGGIGTGMVIAIDAIGVLATSLIFAYLRARQLS